MQVEHVEFVAEEAYHATNLQNTSAHNNLDLPPRYDSDTCQNRCCSDVFSIA